MSSSLLTLHARFCGKVQGVGFRWTVLDIAERHSLVGVVRNLPDGSVEALAQGTKEQIEAFLADVQVESGSAKIESVETQYKKSTENYTNFRIVI